MSELLCRMATHADQADLKALWKLCFPEDLDTYIDGFLQLTDLSTQCCCGFLHDRPVTMLFLLPASATLEKRTWPVRYLYAGCTHPAFRKNGFYSTLMRYAAQQAAGQGSAAIYLHPATEPLFDYYKNLGYRSHIAGTFGPIPDDTIYWKPAADFAALFAECKQQDGWTVDAISVRPPCGTDITPGDCLWLPLQQASSLIDAMEHTAAFAMLLGD